MGDLDELDRLHAAATPGTWTKFASMQATRRDGTPMPCRDQYSLRAHYRVPCTDTASATAPFDMGGGLLEQDAAAIVALHNAYLALAAELRALREVAKLAEAAAAKLHSLPIEGSLTLAEALDAALAKARAAGEGG